MTRTARKKSKSGIYHLILRGINRQTIFEEEDAKKFLETLEEYKEKSGYKIYAYSLLQLFKEENLLFTSLQRESNAYARGNPWRKLIQQRKSHCKRKASRKRGFLLSRDFQ